MSRVFLQGNYSGIITCFEDVTGLGKIKGKSEEGKSEPPQSSHEAGRLPMNETN